MSAITPNAVWLLAAAVAIGHCGLHLALYNWINATGLPRKLLKAIAALLLAEMLLTPVAVLSLYPELLGYLSAAQLDISPPSRPDLPAPLIAYGLLCLATWPVLGIPWLLWRPIFGLEWTAASRRVDVVDVTAALGKSLARTPSCRWRSKLPLNQMFELSLDEIVLPVHRLPARLDGYRIAHLSDIHLTGDVHPDFPRYAVERANEWQPELMALTGDIIDNPECIAWLEEIFSPAKAPDGCYFTLGNHDTRVKNPDRVRRAMEQAGWVDLGRRSLRHPLRQTPSLLVGNEYPWFERPELPTDETDEDFRLLLSHSPDQFAWARRHRMHLMLAGHTHGGQGRLPLAGPLLSPSLHGSRYASGDFYRAPTTMHVSRGLGGTHLMRISCRPELSLIILRAR